MSLKEELKNTKQISIMIRRVRSIKRSNKKKHETLGYYYDIVLSDGSTVVTTDDELTDIYRDVLDPRIIQRLGWHMLIDKPFPVTDEEFEVFNFIYV